VRRRRRAGGRADPGGRWSRRGDRGGAPRRAHPGCVPLPLYAHLLRAGMLPTPHTLPSLLKSVALSPCAPGAAALALAVYAHAVKLGLDRFLLVSNALIRVHADLLGRLAGVSCGLPPPWTPHGSTRSSRQHPRAVRRNACEELCLGAPWWMGMSRLGVGWRHW
jgi:hypothetical protein